MTDLVADARPLLLPNRRLAAAFFRGYEAGQEEAGATTERLS